MQLYPHRIGLALLALLTLAATNGSEPSEFKTYDIGFADGANATEVVKTVIGENGKVFFDPASRQMMVWAPSNQQATVSQIMKQLNVTPRNVRIEVQFRNQGSDNHFGAALSGQGAVIMDSRGTRSSFRVQPHVEDQRTESSSSSRQQLLVTSGRQASLFIGEEVPYIEWIMDYGRRYHCFDQQLTWQRVGSSLVIEPTVIGTGPMIRVRLTPELSGLVNNNPYRTRFATVATEVMVSDGVPFTLGGLAQQNEFYSRFLIGVDRLGAHQTLDIELTAYIVEPTGIGSHE